MATANSSRSGKVKEVCKDFLLKADEQLAFKLQDEECKFTEIKSALVNV